MRTNLYYSYLSISARVLSNLLVYLFTARILGPTTFGEFAFVLSLAMILNAFVDLGLTQKILREGEKKSEVITIFSRITGLRIIISTPVIGLVLLSGLFFETWWLVLLLIVSNILFSIVESMMGSWRRLGWYKEEFYFSIVSVPFFLLIICSVTYLNPDISSVCAAFLIARLVIFFSAIIISNKLNLSLISIRELMNYREFRVFKEYSWYSFDYILNRIYNLIDVVLVGILFGAEATGIYQVGAKYLQAGYVFIQVINNRYVPRISRLDGVSDQLKRIVIFLIGESLVIPLFIVTPLLLFPDFIVAVTLGNQYLGLVDVLQLFSALLFLKYLSGGTGIVLSSLGFQKLRTKIVLMQIMLLFGYYLYLGEASLKDFLAYLICLEALSAVFYVVNIKKYYDAIQ